MNYLMRNLLVCLVFMFSLMYGKMNCESNQAKLNQFKIIIVNNAIVSKKKNAKIFVKNPFFILRR